MSEQKTAFPVDYFKEEYAALYYLSNAVISKPVWYVVLTVVWTVVVLGGVYSFIFGLPEGVNLPIFIGFAVMLVFAGIYLPLYPSLTRRLAEKIVAREYLEGKRRDNKKEITLGKKGIEVTSFGKTKLFPWSKGEKIRADQNYMAIFFQGEDPILIPKKDLTGQMEKMLRESSGIRRIVQYP